MFITGFFITIAPFALKGLVSLRKENAAEQRAR
jgi:hypothetical protein